MATEKCPSCGAELPPELGQHALAPTAGLVQCPTCGAAVTIERPAPERRPEQEPGGDTGEGTGPESFSGHETVEGVMEELRLKEDE
jgi:hypothetical protein